jgi:hypothetical protein
MDLEGRTCLVCCGVLSILVAVHLHVLLYHALLLGYILAATVVGCKLVVQHLMLAIKLELRNVLLERHWLGNHELCVLDEVLLLLALTHFELIVRLKLFPESFPAFASTPASTLTLTFAPTFVLALSSLFVLRRMMNKCLLRGDHTEEAAQIVHALDVLQVVKGVLDAFWVHEVEETTILKPVFGADSQVPPAAVDVGSLE